MMLAAALLLPLITGGNRELGNMLCPMHIPVLFCGFICGWQWGLAAGFAAPLFRGLIFGAPSFMPIGVPMALELAVYGLSAGLLYKLLPKKAVFTYLSLFSAMLLGRLAMGAARYFIFTAGLHGAPYDLSVFLTEAFVKAWPGMVIQAVLIPPLVLIMGKSD